MNMGEKFGANGEKLKNEPPADIQLYVATLLASMENQHLSLKQARARSIAEIESSKDYDSSYAVAKELMEKAARFLREQGIE